MPRIRATHDAKNPDSNTPTNTRQITISLKLFEKPLAKEAQPNTSSIPGIVQRAPSHFVSNVTAGPSTMKGI